MKLILMQFLTLDGVCQGPGGPDEDTADGFTQGGWFVPYLDDSFMRRVVDWTVQADAYLFGRRTYEAFAQAWPKATDPNDPVAASLNGRPKYVASHSHQKADWRPATILSGDVAAEVAELKRRPGRELQVHGSARLGRSLLAAGLIDELRLVIAPVILGHGRRLFAEDGAPSAFRLLKQDTTASGLSILVLEAVGAPSYGSYEVG